MQTKPTTTPHDPCPDCATAAPCCDVGSIVFCVECCPCPDVTYTHRCHGHLTRIVRPPRRVAGGVAVDVASPHFMQDGTEFHYTTALSNLRPLAERETTAVAS